MTYYRLLAPQHKGQIARAEGRSQQEYIPGRGWVDSGILVHYLWPDSDIFERFEEIGAAEAARITGGIL